MKILRYIKTIFVAGPKIIYYHFKYMVKFAKNPSKYPLEYRFGKVQILVRYVLDLMHVDYNFKGMDKFYNLKGNALIVSNHLSDADPMILIANSKKPVTFISKIETFKFPFAGKIAKALEVFPLDRKNLMNQVKQIRNIVSYLKDKNKPSVIVYIEGTRNKHPENPCLDFHPGSLKIAQNAGVPLVSVATYGTFRILDKKSCLKRVPTHFSLLKIRTPEEIKDANTSELAIELKKEIDAEVDRLRKVDLDYLKTLNLSKKKFELESFCDSRVKS